MYRSLPLTIVLPPLTGCASILGLDDVTLADAGSSTSADCIQGKFAAPIPPSIDIPDFSTPGIMSPISVMGTGTVTQLALSLTITHPSPVDITIYLRHVDGPIFTVREGEVSPPPDIENIEIEHDVITKFNGQPAAGTWVLQVEDLADRDVGTLDAWSLELSTDCHSQIR